MNTRQRIGLFLVIMGVRNFPSKNEVAFAIQFICILIGGMMFISGPFSWEEA